MSSGLAVLGAPSAIGLVPDASGKPRRLDLAPDALRAKGLVERLDAEDFGDVAPPPRYLDLERPVGRCRNEDDIAAYSREIADRVARRRRAGQFVLLLGGDCSIVLGALLGLRRADPQPPGLVYIDAHADFASLDESPSGSACSMALALAVGREDQPLAQLWEGGPLVSTERVAHIGRRERASTTYGDDELLARGALDGPVSQIRTRGPIRVAQDAAARASAGAGGFWVHFDVDAFDPSVMPATGDRAPAGIDLTQANELLGDLLAQPAAVGLQMTLYDPTLDVDGSAANDLVALLTRVFAERRAG